MVVFSIITFGIYTLFFWWRVSREMDALQGRRHAHGLMRLGILLTVIAGAVIVMLMLVFAAVLLGNADNDGDLSDEGIFRSLLALGVAAILVALLAALAAAAGWVIMLVAEYRVWCMLRDEEVRFGRADTVNPPLYLWLPLGLSLLGNFIPLIGMVFGLAGSVLTLVFLAFTQGHLNDLWARAAPPPPPPWVA